MKMLRNHFPIPPEGSGMSSESKPFSETQSTFLCEFFIERCVGIPKLVAENRYEPEVAMEEVENMIESIGRLTNAPDDVQSRALSHALHCQAALISLGVVGLGGTAAT